MRVAVNPYFNDPIMRQFFGLPAVPSRELVQQSLGSGVIVDAQKGYVLTNNHVIAGADDIKVTLTGRRAFKAKLVGTDPETDVAVMQIHAPNLVALPLADSSKLARGRFRGGGGRPVRTRADGDLGHRVGLRRQGLRQERRAELHPDRRLDQSRAIPAARW